MATSRPLKLRSPDSPREKQIPASDLPIAHVWVDNSVYHLNDTYEYFIPASLSHDVQVGMRVVVPFGHAHCEGLVVARTALPEGNQELKYIEKILSLYPVATEETIALFRQVSERWVGTPWDVIRAAIPPRMARVEKEELFVGINSASSSTTENISNDFLADSARLFWALPADPDPFAQLAKIILARSDKNQVLVILSDVNELEGIASKIDALKGGGQYSRIDSGNDRSARYREYLEFITGKKSIALGLRGAIFTPLLNGSTIIISHESSPHLYEPRSPRWNARDVALLRATNPETSVILTGFSPSLEVARLIDLGWLKSVQSHSQNVVVASEPKSGELIPSKGFSVIRSALQQGPVLFLVPSKGYGNAILCSRCRNVALCECGARLLRKSSQAQPECSLCKLVIPNWHCTDCGSADIYLASRGIDRFAEEIGRSFPNYPIINSSGDHIIREIERKSQLVLTTPGAEPKVPGGYAAVVLLESNRFFGHASLRGDERAREQFFAAASLATPGATIYIATTPGHPIVPALTRWNAAGIVARELQQRSELGLPPYRRFIRLEMLGSEAMQIFDGITLAKTDLRLPQTLEIRPPIVTERNIASIHLSVPYQDAIDVTRFLSEYQNRRSIAKKELLTIHVDPYELS